MRALPPLHPALFSACFIEGCGSPPCSDLPCPPPYSIQFEASSWDRGLYVVELMVDGKEGICGVTLPLDASSQGTCSLPGVRLQLPMNTVPSGLPGPVGLTFTTQPSTVRVTVKRDGATMGPPASFKPTYGASYPDGPECVPCPEAHDKMKL